MPFEPKTIDEIRNHLRPTCEEDEAPEYDRTVAQGMAIQRGDGKVWNHAFSIWVTPRQYDDEDFELQMLFKPDRVLLCGGQPEIFTFLEKYADEYEPVPEDEEDFLEEDYYIPHCDCDDENNGAYLFRRLDGTRLKDGEMVPQDAT